MADLPVLQLDNDIPTLQLDNDVPDVPLSPYQKVMQHISGIPAGALTAGTTLVGSALSPIAGIGALLGGGDKQDAYDAMGNFVQRSRFPPINPVAEETSAFILSPFEKAMLLVDPLLKESGKALANSPVGRIEQNLTGRKDISAFIGEMAPMFIPPTKMLPGLKAPAQFTKAMYDARGMGRLDTATAPTEVAPPVNRRIRRNTPVNQMEQTSIEGIPTIKLDQDVALPSEPLPVQNAGQGAFEFFKPEDAKVLNKGDVPDFISPTEVVAPSEMVFRNMPAKLLKEQADYGVLGAQKELARRAAEPVPVVAEVKKAVDTPDTITLYRGEGKNTASATELVLSKKSTGAPKPVTEPPSVYGINKGEPPSPVSQTKTIPIDEAIVPKVERPIDPLAQEPIKPDPLDIAPPEWTEPLVKQSIQPKQAKPLSPAAQLFKERYEASKAAKATADFEARRRNKQAERVEEPEAVIDKQLDESLMDEWNRKLRDEGMPEELPAEDLDIASAIEDGDIIPDKFSTDRGRASLNFDAGFMGSQMAQRLYEASVDAIRRNPNVQNMVRLAKTAVLDGARTFGEFRTKARQVLGESWDAVSAYALKAWNAAKAWNDRIGESGAVSIKGVQERLAEMKKRRADKANMPGPNIITQLTGEDGVHRILTGQPKTPTSVTKVVPSVSLLGEKVTPREVTVHTGPLARIMKSWGTDLFKYEGTIAEPIISKAIDAQSVEAHNIGINKAALDDISMGLTKLEQEAVRGAMEGKPSSPAVMEAAGKARAWLDGMRARWQDHMLKEFERDLPANQFNALVKVLDGESWIDVIRDNKVDVDTLGSLVKRVDEIGKWGLNDYIPNVELGRIAVVNGKGEVVFYAATDIIAGKKAAEYWAAHPEVGNLHIVDNPNVFAELRTGLSGKQYHAIANKLAKAMEMQAEEITKQAAKEMSYRAMEGNFKVNPPKVFSEFTIPRRDILEGEKNIIPVLYKYSRIMEKKMAYDPVISDVQKAINAGKMDSVMVNDMQNLVQSLKGEYTVQDKMLDAALKEIYGWTNEKLGTELEAPTFAYTRMFGAARTVNANVKLGYRLVATAVNRVSSDIHIATKTGRKLLGEADAFMETPTGKQLIKETESRLGSSVVDESGDVRSSTPMWAPLGTFQAVEAYVRPRAIAANYLLAKKMDPTMTHNAAREFAVRANATQNFIYNVASLPAYARGPFMKTIFQFKPYLVQELQFISTLRGAEIPRYMTGMMMLGGPRALVAILKSLPIIGSIAGFDNLEEWMNKEIPRISRGIPGMFPGVDISASAAIQFPATASDWVGSVFSPVLDLLKMAGQKAMGVDVDMSGFARKATVDQIVIAKNMMEAVKLAIDGDGWVRDSKGDRQYNIYEAFGEDNKATGVASYVGRRVLMGATPLEQSREQLAGRVKTREAMVLRENKTITTDKLIEHFRREKEIPQAIWDNVVAYGISGDSIRNSNKFKQLDPRTRRLLQAALAQKAHIVETHPTQEDMSGGALDMVIPTRRNRFQAPGQSAYE